MSNGKSDLFVYLGAAFATLFGLAILQKWYGSYIDVRYHQHLAEAGPSEAAVAARQADLAALQKGKVPLDQAISRFARADGGRASSISPTPSQDLSAISGWIHHPGFKPVVAHPIRTARAPVAAKPAPAPAAAAPEAAAAPASAAPAAAPAPATVDKPASGSGAKRTR